MTAFTTINARAVGIQGEDSWESRIHYRNSSQAPEEGAGSTEKALGFLIGHYPCRTEAFCQSRFFIDMPPRNQAPAPDLFSDEIRRDPFPLYEQMRRASP